MILLFIVYKYYNFEEILKIINDGYSEVVSIIKAIQCNEPRINLGYSQSINS